MKKCGCGICFFSTQPVNRIVSYSLYVFTIPVLFSTSSNSMCSEYCSFSSEETLHIIIKIEWVSSKINNWLIWRYKGVHFVTKLSFCSFHTIMTKLRICMLFLILYNLIHLTPLVLPLFLLMSLSVWLKMISLLLMLFFHPQRICRDCHL